MFLEAKTLCVACGKKICVYALVFNRGPKRSVVSVGRSCCVKGVNFRVETSGR